MGDGVLYHQRGARQGAAGQPVLAPHADCRRLLHVIGRLKLDATMVGTVGAPPEAFSPHPRGEAYL